MTSKVSLRLGGLILLYRSFGWEGCFIVVFLIFIFGNSILHMMVPSGSSGGSNGVGGGSNNMMGSSTGSGWTSFDLRVLEEPFADENGEEAQPVQAIPPEPEPDLDSVKKTMRERLIVHRLGKRHATVSEQEIDRIVDLKGQIVTSIECLN